MVSKPHIPRHFSVITNNVFSSYDIKDDLREQRERARELLREGHSILDDYYTNGQHPLVSPDTSRWALARNDHTTLRPNANEDKDYMRRMLVRSLTPVPVRALCSREEQIKMVLDIVKEDDEIQGLLAQNPDFMIACVSGSNRLPAFPHFYTEADQVWRDLEGKAKIKEEMAKYGANFAEYDSVIPYMHWLDGDFKKVGEILDAEAAACEAFGFTWKSILKISVHAHSGHNAAFGADFFQSVYRATEEVLQRGAACAKTSSGLGAMPPLNDLVSKDDGAVLPKALPMIMGVAAFNAANGTKRWPKFSGGNTNEAEGAVLKHITELACGDDVADLSVIGAGVQFRDRNVQYIYEQEGAKSGVKPADFAPYQQDFSKLPAHRVGWGGSKASNANTPLPPELANAGSEPDTAIWPDQGL